MADLIKKAMKTAVSFLTKKVLVVVGGVLFTIGGAAFLGIAIFIILLIGISGGSIEDQNSDSGGFGGGSYQVNGLSPHVLAYESLVHKHATNAGIPEYTPVILAIMQRESGGSPNSLDPMQSSESLCGSVGCISSPDKSIQQGVRHFKKVLIQAGHDLKLTVSSYNFGSGFINRVNNSGKKFEFDKTIGGLQTSSIALKFSQDEYKKVLARGGKYTCSRQGVDLSSYQACYGDIFYVQDVLSYITVLEDGGFEIKDGNVSETRKNIATVGTKWIGKTRYHWGGGRNPQAAARGEYDCSSFVHWAYKENGIELGNIGSVSTETLNKMGTKIPMSDIKIGDLIFWDSYKKDGHVGIYVGDGKFIGSQSSTGVAIEPLNHSYWSPIFSGHVRRIIND